MNWHDYFTYDPTSGELRWKERPRSHFNSDHGWLTSKKRDAGKRAGGIANHGYSTVRVNYKPYYSHRIAWEMANGPIPEGMQVDHIDMDRSNNRLSNLRVANNAQNNSNRGLQSNNTSGFKGVAWDPRRSKWVATIKINGKAKRLGRFATKGLAAVARAKATMRYQGQFARI